MEVVPAGFTGISHGPAIDLDIWKLPETDWSAGCRGLSDCQCWSIVLMKEIAVS
ncbi:hypothetical protein KCP77_17590 [Salmonella enterica subsp. enterica]|nr:hypothetical protein KCP77_17590 [Salmonella enterica subsp. enterica]